jgi:hypothetical protein
MELEAAMKMMKKVPRDLCRQFLSFIETGDH